jgi:hypothetical protein
VGLRLVDLPAVWVICTVAFVDGIVAVRCDAVTSALHVRVTDAESVKRSVAVAEAEDELLWLREAEAANVSVSLTEKRR